MSERTIWDGAAERCIDLPARVREGCSSPVWYVTCSRSCGRMAFRRSVGSQVNAKPLARRKCHARAGIP